MRRAFVEWCVITIILLILAVGLSLGRADSVSSQLQRVDAGIYSFANHLDPLDADPTIVIVEIDEASLAQIGRWPWPRTVHVAMLQKLTEAGARVIGLDVLMAEPSDDDQALSTAIATSSPTVLPVTSETDRDGRVWPVYPVYAAGQQAQLGHAHFSFDIDGVVRGLNLEEGGLPAFGLAVFLQAGGQSENPDIQKAMALTTATHRGRIFSEGAWSESHFVLLPGVRPASKILSYAAILSGDQPDPALQGKTVLIGATAAGMRDAFTNAVLTGETISAGVELHAAAITAIAANRLQYRVHPAWHALLTTIIILGTMLILYRTNPRHGLIATLGSLLLILVISLALLRLAGVWVPPGGTLAAVLIAYPLWSWRRLEAVVSGLIEQARSLRRAPDALMKATAGADIVSSFRPEHERARLGRFLPPLEPIAMELQELRDSTNSITGLRLLLATVLEGLPHAALVCDSNGVTLMRNRVARECFPTIPTDQPTWPWFAAEFGDDPQMHNFVTGNQIEVTGLERRDREGRDWLIDSTRVQATDLPNLWLLQFTNISEIRNLQRQREEMMRFISHDLRSPQISIISAVDQIPPENQNQWTTAITDNAQRSLLLAESFVHWTRAESKPFADEVVDLAAIATEAVDAAWLLGGRGATPVNLQSPDQAMTTGDSQLIRRAVGNLIENAIKYGGDNNTVTVNVYAHDKNWILSVSDTGPGLGDIDSEAVFAPYVRGNNQTDRSGTGLGLALVRMVAQRHGGTASASNRPQGGAEFKIIIPKRVTEPNPD
ncbi:MAG: CHASE2 domain-containing protein [Burkholderiaceae bacterium]